MISMINKY